MKLRIFALCICVIFVSACKKEANEPERKFVAGELLIGLHDSITIEQAFHFSDSLSFPLMEAGFYTYKTDVQIDSLSYVDSLLNIRSYLSKDFTGCKIINNQIQVNTRFIDLDSNDLQDWKLFAQKLRLQEIKYAYKSMMLKVPEGQEKYWEATLKYHPYVRWIELNYYNEINLFE